MDYLPDTSVIVDGRFRNFINGIDSDSCIIFSETMLSEVEHQANQNRSVGFAALEEMKKIRSIAEKKGISLEVRGKRPLEWQMKNGKSGELDSAIRNDARELNATLVTGDRVQGDLALIKGINVIYLPAENMQVSNIEDFFLDETISVHIKAGTSVRIKNGKPGSVNLVTTSRIVNEIEADAIANQIIMRAGNEERSMIEMDMSGATVVQLGKMRIVITRRPFSSSTEITAVRPIKSLDIENYNLSDNILGKILSGSSGILVAGSPGAGKSTFVQALANYLSRNGMIVKTMERPRDLQVDPEITQYTALDGSMEKTGDILLLVRNDYTIFDEMRVTSDFKTYADLRLAGVGMIGVVHATAPIDAIQRFIGRVELGMIPQIVDTVLFIYAGDVKSIMKIIHTVKVPHGMVQEDLARPVIVVSNAITSEPLYEIYTFGEQIVVVPVTEISNNENLNEKVERIQNFITGALKSDDVKVEMLGRGRARVTVPEELKPKLIGRKGSNITNIEKSLGVSIDVESHDRDVPRELSLDIRNRIIYLDCHVKDTMVSIYVDDINVMSGRTSSKGIIRVKLDSEIGTSIMKSVKEGKIIGYKTQSA